VPKILKDRQVLIVLLGAVCLEPLYLWLHHLRDLEVHAIETITAGLGAGIIYVIIVYALEHSGEKGIVIWVVVAAGLLFRVTLWPLAPTLSNDLYRYRWDGRVQLAGYNPYLVHPSDPALAGLRDPRNRNEMRMPAVEIPTIYPPLAEILFRETARVAKSAVEFKVPMEAADVVVMVLLALWLRREGGRSFQLAIYAWNPLVIVEFAGSGHSDALALAALVGAFVLLRFRGVVSTGLLAAAALLKSFPVLLFTVWLVRLGWPRAAKAWRAAGVAAALVVACGWPYRAAMHEIPRTMANFEANWRDNNSSLYTLLKLFSHSHEVAAGVGVGVAVGLALWCAWRGVDPPRAALWIFGAVLLFSPNAYSWYFTWVIPFLCFYPSAAWMLLTVLQFLSYHVLIRYLALDEFHFDPRMVALTYSPFFGMLLWEFFRGARGQRSALTDSEGQPREMEATI
jgi:alpha-1,6-mannosyltransferase